MCVTDAMPESRPAAAHFTNSSHENSNLLRKLADLIVASGFMQQQTQGLTPLPGGELCETGHMKGLSSFEPLFRSRNCENSDREGDGAEQLGSTRE